MVFCHGLFGQGRNWTQIAKAFADDHRVTLVDLPDHGRSPWTGGVDYRGMADHLTHVLEGEEPVALVGHSMGGKVAMLAALAHPQLVERLCVVDVAPVAYSSASEFERFVAAMRGLDLDALTTRDEADAGLVDGVPDPVVRAFLLQNLRREGDSWRWQVNLDVLGDDLDTLRGWPEDAAAGLPPYDGPVLWIAGETSSVRPRRARRDHGAALPEGAPGDRQERRPLGALRAAGGVRRGAPHGSWVRAAELVARPDWRAR